MNSEKSGVYRGKDKIVIYGCGGHARSIINTIYETDRADDILLVDDNVRNGEMILKCQTVNKYNLSDNDAFIVAIGDNKNRKELFEKLNKENKGYCISIVSMLSSIGTEGEIGNGSFIAPYAYIGPQAKVGNNSIINTGSIVEHETIIGNHTHIAPHATICGRSKIGDNVFCGAGCTVIDRITICSNVVIGAGAVVIADIVEAGTYVGIPAKRIN